MMPRPWGGQWAAGQRAGWLRPALGSVLLAMSLAASAHHSPAQWDLTRRISIEGTVQEVEFRNPHGHMTVLVKPAKGKAVTWDVETSAVNLLMRRGWKPRTVKTGMAVKISGHPHKTVAAHIYMREISLPGGVLYGDPTGNDKALD
jgi:Family of unknown function (DUF6152)